MASVIIRNLSEATKMNLRIQAARSGQSLEAYIRKVLDEKARQDEQELPDILAISRKYFADEHLILELSQRESRREEVTFSE